MRSYRGRRLDNGEWVYGGLIKPLNSPRRYIGYIELMDEGGEVVIVHYDEVDPATVGQSTGKLDKNKNLIYAGDLVRDTQRGAWAKGYVLWDEENARFKVDNPGLYDCMGRKFEWSDLEVIGNIHDKEKDNG